MNNFEKRSFTAPFQSEGKTLRGYAAVFNSPTEISEGGRRFTEVIKRGAFRSAIESKADIISTFNHDPNRLLGRTSAGTLRLREDDKGLLFEVDLPDHAADIKEMLERGDLQGASFTFTTRRNGEIWDGNTRTVTDVYLFELGPVVMPAYPSTSLLLRSNDKYRKLLELKTKYKSH